MAGTVMPIWRPQFLDANGAPLASGTVETYESGTSTPLATYSNEGLTVSNGTTITLNAGGFPTVSSVEVAIFLLPRAYRFVLKNSAGTTQRTIDGVYALQAASSVNLEIDGTAGEALTAGEFAYQSDGSNALTAGRWYRTDSDLYYASIHPNIAYVPSAIASGGTGTLRIGGVADGLSALSAGTTYYLSGTAGALTATAPANARPVGVARSATAIDLTLGSRWVADGTALMCEGRLTSSTGQPIGTGSAATTIYFAPYVGNRVALYTGTAWRVYAFTELSLALSGGTASRPHDVFLYDNAGTLTLELTAWTNASTRATALTRQDGVYVKTGATTRRYLGTIYLNASNQISETVLIMTVWNYYHRVTRSMVVTDGTDSWTYDTTSYRQARGAAANQLEVVIGVAEDAIAATLRAFTSGSAAGKTMAVAIGVDSTTAAVAGSLVAPAGSTAAGEYMPLGADYRASVAAGYHTVTWLEKGGGATTTFYGDAASADYQSGLTATVAN